jgi:hypothetical protein
MKLKLDDAGHAVLADGKPVYIHDDGREIPFDGAMAFAKIGQLTGEAASHRKRAETAEANLAKYEGIEDPDAAKKALETLGNLDKKKLIDAGEVEKVKAEISKAYETKLGEATKRAETLEQQLYSEKIGGSFARSKLIAEKLAIPADMVQARFGQAFKIEDGKVVAYDQSGNKIFSRTRPGELADFDEAIEALVDAYPYKGSILKGSGASGMGAGSSAHGGAQVKKFSEMNEAERVKLYEESPERYQQLRNQG